MSCDLGLQPGICLGPLPVCFYGIIIVFGAIVGGYVAVREARRFQHRLKDGDLILLYLIWYPANRILVESLRPDAWTVVGTGLATAQLVSIGFILAAIVLFFLRHRPGLPTSTRGA
jgi:prolipoprotein diacylglyceryltransferase